MIGSEKLVIGARLTFLFVSNFEEFGYFGEELLVRFAVEGGFITPDASAWLLQAEIKGRRVWFGCCGGFRKITRRSLVASRSLGGIVALRRFNRSFVRRGSGLVFRVNRADGNKRVIRLSKIGAGD